MANAGIRHLRPSTKHGFSAVFAPHLIYKKEVIDSHVDYFYYFHSFFFLQIWLRLKKRFEIFYERMFGLFKSRKRQREEAGNEINNEPVAEAETHKGKEKI